MEFSRIHNETKLVCNNGLVIIYISLLMPSLPLYRTDTKSPLLQTDFKQYYPRTQIMISVKATSFPYTDFNQCRAGLLK